jgi:hypothetical protein
MPDDLKKEIAELHGEPFKLADECIADYATLFPDEFISNRTAFQSLPAMIDAFRRQRGVGFIPGEWSRFVAANSNRNFSGWQEMYELAHQLFIAEMLQVP